MAEQVPHSHGFALTYRKDCSTQVSLVTSCLEYSICKGRTETFCHLGKMLGSKVGNVHALSVKFSGSFSAIMYEKVILRFAIDKHSHKSIIYGLSRKNECAAISRLSH